MDKQIEQIKICA